MIETQNLTKRFPCSTADKGRGRARPGDEDTCWFTAVDGVSLEVPAGEILALLGPNGAGKTTTVRMLAGILKPSAGQARVAGLNTVHQAREVRQAIGLLTEFPGLYLRMRAGEYLAFFGALQGLDAATIRCRTAALAERFGLAHNLSQRLAEYSKGMRQKLALIRAMLHDPALLLLDEPTSALDPQGARQVRDAVLQLRRERHTVLLCTHNLAEAELLADRIAIIHRGRIVALDTPGRLKAELLGPPLQEVRLAHALDGTPADLADLVQIEDRGETWFRYRTPSPETTNPEVVARLAGLHARVLALGEVPRSLEEVYLRIVGSDRDDH
ncbi:MAG TPA: ABC transporter ATP-binding protein [Anaerolineae bacterium]|nr:ABC transporter ATP-binding protein [Anaerolineae bacterium]